MIAFAITCLLVATVALALLSSTDSLMRGWHSYRALADELRALRAAGDAPVDAGADIRRTKLRPSRRSIIARRIPAAGLRAAA